MIARNPRDFSFYLGAFYKTRDLASIYSCFAFAEIDDILINSKCKCRYNVNRSSFFRNLIWIGVKDNKETLAGRGRVEWKRKIAVRVKVREKGGRACGGEVKNGQKKVMRRGRDETT